MGAKVSKKQLPTPKESDTKKQDVPDTADTTGSAPQPVATAAEGATASDSPNEEEKVSAPAEEKVPEEEPPLEKKKEDGSPAEKVEEGAQEADEIEMRQRLRDQIHNSSRHLIEKITEDIDHAAQDTKLSENPSRANLHARGLKHANVWEFYTKGRIVGKGMCGNVYQATHKTSGQKCAVKSVRKCNVKPKLYKDLLKEISMLQALDHPNVVKMVEAFDDAKNIYLVTELCEGGELYQHLIEEGYYDEQRAMEVFKMMVNAIRYCHRCGVCSRDLKLENFVFQSEDKDSPLKLLDFGLACHFGQGLGRMQSMVGTPYYVAPEILKLGDYDDDDAHYTHKCDIWSLGIILYMLLSGTPPFSAKSTQGILRKIRNGQVEFPDDLFGDVSPEARDLCARMLIKDPELRIPIEQLVLHPWLKTDHSSDRRNSVNNAVVQQLKTFADYCHMQKAAIEVISVLLSDDQIAHLRSEFQKMDTNGSGTITLDEFARALSHEVSDKEQLNRIFSHVDRNGSGEISYSEFLAASVHHSIFSNEKHLRASYERLAADQEGIPIDKLKHLLSENLCATEVERVLQSIDKNSDGVVCWAEYLAVMKATVDEKLSEDERKVEQEILQLHDALSLGPVPERMKPVKPIGAEASGDGGGAGGDGGGAGGDGGGAGSGPTE